MTCVGWLRQGLLLANLGLADRIQIAYRFDGRRQIQVMSDK